MKCAAAGEAATPAAAQYHLLQFAVNYQFSILYLLLQLELGYHLLQLVVKYPLPKFAIKYHLLQFALAVENYITNI